MRIRLLHLWEQLRSSYWFIPALMTAGAVVLGLAMPELDEAMEGTSHWALRWLYRGGIGGAQAVLSTIAGSMITVAGVTFSVVIVAFTLASTQFGPRLLLTFMRDLGNQVVLGTFIATFVYCLVVLWTTGGASDASNVPSLSVALAVGMAVSSLGVLIYFIHHAAASIQAPNIVASVGQDLDEAIGRFFTDEVSTGPAPPRGAGLPDGFEKEAFAVFAEKSGYVQAVDEGALLAAARDRDLLLRVNFRPGDFVTQGSALVHAWPARGEDPVLEDEVNGAFLVGNQRTPTQDVGFVVNQLVEVAVRALSPAINDPFTAMTCIDWLGAALARIARSPAPSAFQHDEKGELRLVLRPMTFARATDFAFEPIREYGAHVPLIVLRLLQMILTVAEHVGHDADREALLRQARLIEQETRAVSPRIWEREDVRARYAAVLRAVGG
ncbi:MAG TPA: DUF2254 domain-containing protein [Longimicrobiaceae bacterium]